MQAGTHTEAIAPDPRNFWLYWLGQIISSLGSSVTAFALPLLVFRLTGSAMDLAFSTTLTLLPYLCFGLIIGAWVDRVDRRRLMVATDIGRALVIALIPLLDGLRLLTIESIYLVIVVNATLAIGFDAAAFAALPNLVHPDDLVTTNGRMQAGYSIAGIAGPLLAGLLLAIVSLTLYGVCTVGLAASRHYWVALLWWSAIAGAAMLWNIISLSLAQSIVPNELFGRVVTFARLLSWVAIPISALIGGALIEWTRNVALVYDWLGGLTIVVTGAFFFTPLARVR